MKSWILIVCSLNTFLLSCSVVNGEYQDSQITEEVNGIILVFQQSCFFIPSDYCNYLACDNSVGRNNKALIVDHILNGREIKSYNPIVAKIKMLPNKDESDIIVWLERCHFNTIKEDECYIISAKVKLTMNSKSIENLSFLYRLRFIWQGTVYNYECIYKGQPISCEIISLNDIQRYKIRDTHSLPIGRERSFVDSL